MKKILLFTLINLLSFSQNIIKLIPPSLSSTYKKIACDRPFRAKGVNISIDTTYKNKTILHCYGHGGFGFTTLFGSIKKSIKLLLKQNISFNTPICILGSGCIGLTMAIELYRYGFENIKIITENKYNIPSWVAGGFFDPGTGNENSKIELFHAQLGLKSFYTLQQIENGQHPYITKNTVTILPIYCPKNMNIGVELLTQYKLMPPAEIVSIQFNNITYKDYKKQYTYFIDVGNLMLQLWDTVKKLNIPVINKKIKKFSECEESIICNCTGLGSYLLNNDISMNPGRGHSFLLSKNNQILNYMLFTKINNKDIIYFFSKNNFVQSDNNISKHSGIIGGTYIKYNTDCNLDKLDKKEFDKLKNRVINFFGLNQNL